MECTRHIISYRCPNLECIQNLFYMIVKDGTDRMDTDFEILTLLEIIRKSNLTLEVLGATKILLNDSAESIGDHCLLMLDSQQCKRQRLVN